MADVNANIGVNIDTSLALTQLKSLQRQISQFHTSIARSSETAALAQKSLQKNFLNSVNAIGSFSAELRTVKTTTESFTASLEGNKFSMREYFRYAGGATKTFGRLFKSEFDTIGKVAEERVKRLQTQYIKMGRDVNGSMQAISIMPTALDMENYGTKTALAAQKQALFNQLMKQGSTNLLNFGKNTQWAGRQLMVGFTIPLAMVGSAATKTFMDMEEQAIKFKKVYGDLFTPKEETQQALENITELGKSFTKYGVAVSTTVGLAAEAAAAGFSGLDLQRQTTEATRLSILGQLDSQKALETTISLQNSFGMSSEKLADSINFLNAVENQTVVSLDDITTAIPKVAPVIQQLGGDVKDLTFFMAAMKEGGINASEGANALKSGLAALINPTGRASEMLKGFGINANEIVTKNKGNLKATVIEFASALNELDPLNRAQAIEQMFGKFQFARLSTLFANVAKDGNQAARVLSLANSSVEELSALSEQELGMTAESAMNKFKKTVEDLKVALVPVGKAFLEAVTPVVEFVANILEKFGNLSDGTKKAITIMTVAIGGLGPILLMTFGLLANGVANIIKLFLTLRNGYLRLTGQSQILGEQTQYLTMEQIDAAAASHSLNQAHATLTQQFTAESAAVNQLIAAYQGATRAGAAFASANPGAMLPRSKKYANGVISVPGSGKGDTVPAMLTPGEAIIPAAMAKKYAPLINGMIAGNIPGYKEGRGKGLYTSVDVPGSYDVAHFGNKGKSTGAELLQMVEGLDTALARKVREMVGSFSDGLTRTFTTFDNRVVAQFTEINRDMQYKGKTSTSKARENLTGAGFAEVRDIELQKDLLDSGMSIDEYQQVNKKLTEEITKGFDALGNKTEITSDELDNLLRKAYDEVAKTDKRIKKAYDNMQKVTAVTDPRTDSRIAISKNAYTASRKSGKYAKGMTMVSAGGKSPYPDKSRFGITQKMGDELGLGHKDAARVYKQFSDEVKMKLAKLQGDVKGFSAQFAKEAEIAGLKTGNAYKTGVDKSGLKDIYVESRQRKSPHNLASKDGKDDAVAYEEARETTTRTRRRRVSSAAAGAPPVIPQGSVSAGRLSQESAIGKDLQDKIVAETTARKISAERLDQFDRRLMGASFAVSSIAGVTSMFGGSLGSASGAISKLTAAMFALQAITSLLTQSNATKLAMDRIGLAGGAMASAKMAGSAAAGLAGRAGILGTIARVGLGLKVFLGPIGLATGALGLLYGAFKKYQSTQEKARLAIEGLGDAARVSTGKIKSLEDFFGVKATKSNLQRTGTQLALNTKKRSAVDELRSNENFQKEFQKDIKVLRDATNKEVGLVFNSIAMQLSSQGFAKSNIDTLIKALQEEAGKTNVSFDFSNIDLKTEKGRSNLSQTAKDLAKSFSEDFNEGYRKQIYTTTDVMTGEYKYTEVIKMSDAFKKSLSTNSSVISGMFDALAGEIKNNTITSEEFNKSFLDISNTISSMPKPEAMLLLNTALKTMPNELAQASIGIKNMSDQMLVLKAVSLGVTTITKEMIKGLNTASNQEKALIREQIYRGVNDLEKVLDIIKEKSDKTNAYVAGSGPGKSASDKALEYFRLIENRATILNDAVTKPQKAVIDSVQGQIDDINKSIDRIQVDISDKQRAVEMTITRPIEEFQKSIDDIQKRIKDTIDVRMESLSSESAILSEALTIIDNAAEGVNKKYDTQVEALTKISEINSEIADKQKQQIGLADALSRGDVSAAATAVQEMRAASAAAAQKKSLAAIEESRKRDLAKLSATVIGPDGVPITLNSEQIKQRQYNISREQFSLEQSRKKELEQIALIESRDIAPLLVKKLETEKLIRIAEDEIYKLQVEAPKNLRDLNEQLDLEQTKLTNIETTLNNSLQTIRDMMTAIEFNNLQKEIDAAVKSKADAAAKLLGQSSLDKFDKAVAKEEKSAQERSSIASTTTAAQALRLFGGMGSSQSKPRYMSAGGRVGSDSVPAMLTPGEFVINKAASRKFGPILEKINSSKYPSMIKDLVPSTYSSSNSSNIKPMINSMGTNINDNSSTMYNYNVGINVSGSNANSNDIAKAVIGQIKYIDSQRIRGQR